MESFGSERSSIGAAGMIQNDIPTTKEPSTVVTPRAIDPVAVVASRSVEKLYTPQGENLQPQYLRYFVPKFQRRSPLINRGYWLRMRLIRKAVDEFISDGNSSKIIVNLGCGFDPLPFYYISHHPNVKFIDVDYPDSIRRKCEIIRSSPALNDILVDPTDMPDNEVPTILSSLSYLAIGIDMSDLNQLDRFLATHIKEDDEILFLSEVAITYMSVRDADALIKWASRFHKSRFILIEQILPAGKPHPFASTMLSHFRKINSPLQAIGDYPTLSSQTKRFREAGWHSVNACDFFGAWCNMISPQEKEFVQAVEAFDEYEDFVLFGQHYFFLCATSSTSTYDPIGKGVWLGGERALMSKQLTPGAITFDSLSIVDKSQFTWELEQVTGPTIGRRRLGSAASIQNNQTLYFGGIDNKARCSSSLIIDHTRNTITEALLMTRPSARVCHTLTKMQNGSALLVGGRSGPNDALADCWVYNGSAWTRAKDMPMGRYRHSAHSLELEGTEYVLIFGGKGGNRHVYDSWLLWSSSTGWLEPSIAGVERPLARFSACIGWSSDRKSGILHGGFGTDGEIFSDTWTFYFENETIVFHKWRFSLDTDHFGRGGAQMVFIDEYQAIVLGGVSGRVAIASNDPNSFLLLDISNEDITILPVLISGRVAPHLLVGTSCVSGNGGLEIVGGGAVIFSMGSFWNQNALSLHRRSRSNRNIPTYKPDKLTAVPPRLDGRSVEVSSINVHWAGPEMQDIQSTIKRNLPFLIKGLDIGPCVNLWTSEYLKTVIGASKEVVVHKFDLESSTTKIPIHMNFNTKNFMYSKLPFSEFIDIAFSENQSIRCYLRSVSQKPTKHASFLDKDFPEIAGDFFIPLELSFMKGIMHSSPLRISSAGIGIWLHYDVCANFLFQVRGRKRFLLFPPMDITKLEFPAGKTTSSIQNIFEALPQGTNPREIIMEPGDILYIPPFWSHAALPLEPCVAVNTFFQSFEPEICSKGKDLYGNKDLVCYQEGRDILKSVVARFEGLDDITKQFYIARLSQELIQLATNSSTDDL